MFDAVRRAMGKAEIFYKVLNNGGVSPYQNYKWPLPTGPAADVPGAWIDAGKKKPALCVWGLHGYLTRAIAEKEHGVGVTIYEMEIEGDIVKDNTKAAGRRARLLRQVSGPRVVTLGDVGAIAASMSGGSGAAIDAIARGLRATSRSVEYAIPPDIFVVDVSGPTTLRAYLRQARAVDMNEALARRVQAIEKLPLSVVTAG